MFFLRFSVAHQFIIRVETKTGLEFFAAGNSLFFLSLNQHFSTLILGRCYPRHAVIDARWFNKRLLTGNESLGCF